MTDDRSAPLLTAGRFLDAHGFEVPVARSVIMVYDRGLVEQRGRRRWGGIRHRSAHDPRFPFPIARRAGVDVVASGPGAPAAAVTLELLRALGAERVITVGSAAALIPIEIGTRLVITGSRRDGARLGYPSSATEPDPELNGWLQRTTGAATATTLTTDVPFCQTARSIASARGDAAVLEMECAAVFEVAASIGLKAAAIVVVSDRHHESHWSPGDRTTVRVGLDSALDAILGAMTEP